MAIKWDKFRRYLQTQRVPAKTTLLQEGQISKAMFFVEQGCLRTWVNNEGKDITTQFFFEGDSVSSIESFRTSQPSLYSIETLEPSVILTLSKDDFNRLMEESPELKSEMEEHLFARLFHAQQIFYSLIRNSPQQRYEELIKRYPHIVKRIPQHYIASYLGITSVSLSRIRNRR